MEEMRLNPCEVRLNRVEGIGGAQGPEWEVRMGWQVGTRVDG